MPKRFTASEKWNDPWFMELSPSAKLVYLYLLDACDPAGVWTPNYRLANFSIKAEIEWDEVLEQLGDRIQEIAGGKIWIRRFVFFQCGALREACAPHRKVIELLERHGIGTEDPWIKGSACSEAQTAAPRPPMAKQTKFEELPGLRDKAERKADLIFEAIAEVSGVDISRLTTSARGRLNKAAFEIRAAEPGVTPERIRAAAAALKRKYPTAAVTASSLSANWPNLLPAPPTAEMAEGKVNLAKAVRENEAKLAVFMTNAGAVPMPREDLTDSDLAEVRHLRMLIDAQRKAL